MENLSFTCLLPLGYGRVTVPAIKQGLYGVYFNGAPYVPCVATLIEKAPYRFKKAIERATGFWSSNVSDIMRLDLNRARDFAPMGAIHARAVWRENDCFLDGYQFGMLRGAAIRVDSGYQVASICGTVSITVPARVAESRLAAARAENAKPVFMYS